MVEKTRNDRVTINKPKLLIGEGVEEKRFFQKIIRHLEIDDIQVESYNGKPKLPAYLKALKLLPDFQKLISLGITRDADDQPSNSAFDSICNTLQKNNYPYPHTLNEAAILGSLTVSIFILPNNQSPGMLEDLCIQCAQSNPAFSCVETYLQCVSQFTDQQPNNLSKAKIHAWLASRSEPGKRVAEAAEAGYWDWEHPAFESLKQFLRQL